MDEAAGGEESVELRPGVFRPDWTAIASRPAREALRGREESRRCLPDAWLEPLTPTEDFVWRACIRLFAQLGRAPSVPELGGETGVAQTQLESLLEGLQRRDRLAMRGNTLEYAYPFTVRDVGHHVHVYGHTLNALCAIDALGVGAMCNTDVAIESICSSCGAPVRLTTEGCGRHLATISPPEAVVWYEFSSYCNTTASSCCPAISFYCCEDHLRNSRPDRSGRSLMAVEALEVGRALFGPILAERAPQ